MDRIWTAIRVHVLGRPDPGRADEMARAARAAAAAGREDRFEPYIRARTAPDRRYAVYDVTLEGVEKRFLCKADAVSYCSGRMVRLGLNP